MKNFDQNKKEFLENGYTTIKEFYNRDEILEIKQRLSALLDDDRCYNYYDNVLNGNKLILTRTEHFFYIDKKLDSLLLNKKIDSLLKTIIGNKYFLFKDKINYKLPGSSPDLLHQDQAAGWSKYAPEFINIVIMIDENRKKNAAMSFIKNKDYEKQVVEWRLNSNDATVFDNKDRFDLIEGTPGDIIVFDSFIPHGSPANCSDRSRWNIFLTFNDANYGNQRDQYYIDKLINYPPNDKRDDNKEYSYKV